MKVKALIAALAMTASSMVWANCVTNTYFSGTRMTICTTCCYGNNCTTTCL